MRKHTITYIIQLLYDAIFTFLSNKNYYKNFLENFSKEHF